MRFERTLPKYQEDHIAEKGFKSLSHHNFGAQVCSSAASDDNFGSGSSGGQWEELGKSPAWQVSKVRRPKEIILETQKREWQSPLCHADGRLSSKGSGVGTEVSKEQRLGRAPR